MTPLTKIQAEYLGFIKESIVRNQRAPTYREMSQRFHNVSTNAVHDHLQNLAKKSAIAMDHKRARSIMVLNDRLHWQNDLPAWYFCPACILVRSTEHQRFVIRLCADHDGQVNLLAQIQGLPG